MRTFGGTQRRTLPEPGTRLQHPRQFVFNVVVGFAASCSIAAPRRVTLEGGAAFAQQSCFISRSSLLAASGVESDGPPGALVIAA